MMRILKWIMISTLAVALSACQFKPGGLQRNWEGDFATPGSYTSLSTTGVASPLGEHESYPTVHPPVSLLETNQYDIQQKLTLVNRGTGSPSKLNLWVALIDDHKPYQEVLEREISPGDNQILADEHGNLFAEFDFSDMPPGSEIQVRIDYRVETNGIQFDLSHCDGELPDFYTRAELHVESMNPQIVSLSRQLSANQPTACDQVRSFYDYVGNELVYSYNHGNWGAQATLGEMGADCTEYASLMMALSRAAGIPARYVEGLRYAPERENNQIPLEHAWLEIYLPGIGWTPMDPSLGRSSTSREEYFAQLPPDHIIVTHGRNPSTLRGGSYFTYLYWPGNSTEIAIEQADWTIHLNGD